ncbi:low temperature requirement protein A [Aggregicoccus sp. 17bor-14]|uniref:low temperature requirement protein A n=1 Tax=Myxococcaceae TaxID=31 RepID=UPI00129C99D5|nr:MULTISPECIES: low temperature requirement protein A [Myxococcaceae]MBF5043551.1 low temperature requirement protein A [Simulacricoccus sp. 17bor-14]MRI89310.1 low temperature requirement protein A [Aggregicoccus sp. 17bor-14]
MGSRKPQGDAQEDGGENGEDAQDGESGPERNTALESFFDLAFVFVFTQVTRVLTDHPTWLGLAQATALMLALWWSWCTYSWLTSGLAAHEVIFARLMVLGAMVPLMLGAMAIPTAFGQGGLLFGLSYFAVRVLHLSLYALATRGEREKQRAVWRLAPGFLGGSLLLVAAGLVHGVPKALLWAAALGVDYATPLARDTSGLTIHAKHFAERYALVIILALGESIAGIGIDAPDLRWRTLLGAALTVVVAAALWWTYFDYTHHGATQLLQRAQGRERSRLARDAFTYLHLPLVAGILLVADGLDHVIVHPEASLDTVPALALSGGAALYLLGLTGFRLRNVGEWSVPRLVAGLGALALYPLMHAASGLVSVAALAALLVGLAAVEALFPNRHRRKVREAAPDGLGASP